MVHDFVVTRSHIVVPVFPLTGSMERASSGKPGFAWEPEKGTHVAVLPRDGTAADVRWFHGPACYVFHPFNGFDTEATTTGWVLSLRVGREGVREWRTHVARLDANGVPHPAIDAASPCGVAGDPAVRQCKGTP